MTSECAVAAVHSLFLLGGPAMTIEVRIVHKNPGYERKLRVIKQNKNENNEWVDVHSETVESGEGTTGYVHTHSRFIVEEE